jgi:acetoin utilization protein AcuB
MADHKIGGLPVVEGDAVVGLITESDLFRILLELLGAWKPGVRLTAIFAEKHGGLAHLTEAISAVGGSFVAFSQIAGDRPDNWEIMFKVQDIGVEKVMGIVEPLAERIIDVRDSRNQ